MMRRVSASMFFVLCCMPVFVHAAPVTIETHRQDTAHNTFSFLEILHADAEHPLQSDALEEATPVLPRSHVRIMYASKDPLPVRITFPNDPASHHQLTAVLPAADEGDALLALTTSPAWHRMMPPLTIEIYWKGDNEPHIRNVEVQDRLSTLQTWLTYLRQPFMAEMFSSFSLGTIYGYKSAGVSFTLVAGIALLIFVIVLFTVFRKRSLLAIAVMVWVPAILLYESRFLIDIVSATVSDQQVWWTEGQYNDMRYLYAEADVIQRKQDASQGVLSVANCTGLTTPLKYFLLPIPVDNAKAWDTAHIGVLQSVWSADQTTFSCRGSTRTGTILRLFPDGDAVVEFSDHAQP